MVNCSVYLPSRSALDVACPFNAPDRDTGRHDQKASRSSLIIAVVALHSTGDHVLMAPTAHMFNAGALNLLTFPVVRRGHASRHDCPLFVQIRRPGRQGCRAGQRGDRPGAAGHLVPAAPEEFGVLVHQIGNFDRQAAPRNSTKATSFCFLVIVVFAMIMPLVKSMLYVWIWVRQHLRTQGHAVAGRRGGQTLHDRRIPARAGDHRGEGFRRRIDRGPERSLHLAAVVLGSNAISIFTDVQIKRLAAKEGAPPAEPAAPPQETT